VVDMTHLRLLVLATMVTIGAPRIGSADPISITGGSLDIAAFAGPIALAGDRGFTFSSWVDTVGGFFQPTEQCNGNPLQCTPGSTLGLAAVFGGNDLVGTATLDGAAYTHVGSVNSPASMTVNFSGAAVLPPLSASATVTAPFLFSGTFFHPIGDRLVSDALAGSGTATLMLTPNHGFPGSWHVDRARYE